MADMKDFDVVIVGRSDGADTGPGYWPITASAPVASKKPGIKDAPAEKAPRVKPQMARLTEDDPRYVEWRVKLGILLKQELAPNPEDGNSWYVQFPRGYWLYEKSKHLWVSGYPIKSKLFKSPQEFAVHLIWLLSASKDYSDCCCVHCNMHNVARAIQEDTPTLTPSEPVTKSSSKTAPISLPPIVGQHLNTNASPDRQAAVNPVQRSHPSQISPPQQQQTLPQNQTLQQQQQQPRQQIQQVQQPQHMQPQPSRVHPPQTLQQHQIQQVHHQQQQQHQHQQQVVNPQQQQPRGGWSLQSPLLFRSGELVWYQTGNAWRIGVIATILPTGNEILPLGSAFVAQPNIIKSDNEIRPFQTFNVPPVTFTELNGKKFEDVRWDAVFHSLANNPPQREGALLDASKLASINIENSYSLWSPMSDDSQPVVGYYGCFLGAERIEIGDCLRVNKLPAEYKISFEAPILGLRYIFTSREHPGVIFLRGTLYRPANPGVDATTALVPDENLPIALRDDTLWRNSILPKGPRRGWVILQEDVVLKEPLISGRYYPAHRILPILNPEPFKQAVAQRQIDDLFVYLNSRMAFPAQYVGRKRNRLDMLGMSVARHAALTMESHIREEA